MRFAKIRKMDISNGEGIGVSLFTQGCPHHCHNCFNPETWSYEDGKDFTNKEVQEILDLLDRPYIKRFTLLGGEPLIDRNLFMLANLIGLIKSRNPDVKIWCYTGYTLEELKERICHCEVGYLEFILENIDILIDGRFEEDKKDLTIQFRGSSNQRILRMPQSLKEIEYAY